MPLSGCGTAAVEWTHAQPTCGHTFIIMVEENFDQLFSDPARGDPTSVRANLPALSKAKLSSAQGLGNRTIATFGIR